MAKRAESSRWEFWRQAVARQRAGGLSITRFCAQEGLAVATFFAWKRRLGQAGGGGRRGASAVNFAPVRVVTGEASEAAAGALEILLPRERRVRLTGTVDRQQLRDVLAVLAG